MEGKERLAAAAAAAAAALLWAFLWPWRWMDPVHEVDGQALILLLVLAFGSGSGSGPGSISKFHQTPPPLLLSSSFTHSHTSLTSLYFTFTTSLLPLSALSISLTLLPPSPRPPSSLQSIPPPLLQLLASLPSRLPCNNPSAAAAAAFSSERSRPLTPLSRLAYTTAEKKYTAPPPIPIPPPPPSPASFCVLASPPATTSRLVNGFHYLCWLLTAPARFSAGFFVPARKSFMTLIVRCGAARANHPTRGFARWSSRFFFQLCLNKKPSNI